MTSAAEQTIGTEAKVAWVSWGVDQEPMAIERAQRAGLPVIRNPGRSQSRYEIDAAVLCDIKTRRTPFNKAEELYGIPPARCVTLNVDDAERYPPKTLILFDVFYEDLGVRGQWVSFLDELLRKQPAVHHYVRRKDDTVNKTSAYVLDLAWMKRCT